MTDVYSIPDSVKAEIDHWLTKYPPEQKRSAIVAALMQVQEHAGGYLTQAMIEAVADYLEQPSIYVYELATFYDMFELNPIGKHKISVCTNLSCKLMGSDDVVARLEERLGIKMGETTEDGKFTLREVECLAACAYAPACQIDNKEYVEKLTPEKVDGMIDELSKENT